MRGRAEQPGRFGGSGEARATGQRQKCQVCRGTEKVAVATVRVAAEISPDSRKIRTAHGQQTL
jgi:hypothetical protein